MDCTHSDRAGPASALVGAGGGALRQEKTVRGDENVLRLHLGADSCTRESQTERQALRA